jgi:hypothetical protein
MPVSRHTLGPDALERGKPLKPGRAERRKPHRQTAMPRRPGGRGVPGQAARRFRSAGIIAPTAGPGQARRVSVSTQSRNDPIFGKVEMSPI